MSNYLKVLFTIFIFTVIHYLCVEANHNHMLPARRRQQKPKVTTDWNGNVLPCGTSKHVRINESVVIQSPHFNSTRWGSQSCKWRFLFPGCSLALNCPSYRRNDFFCLNYFEIKDSRRTQRYCGRNGPNLEIDAPHKQVEFSYRPNAFSNFRSGFRCQVVCNDDGGGGGVLSGIFGGGIPIGGIITVGTPNRAPAHPVPPSNCSCGEGANGVRIVNGQMTAIGEFPWMTAIVRAGSMVPFCGASLINSRYIMTAAHCVNGRTPDSIQVILNDFKSEAGPGGVMPRDVEAIFSHNRYTARLDNDIAVLKLTVPVDLTGEVVPVCLPTDSDEDYLKKTATVSGWGTTSEAGFLSRYLRKADVDVIGNDQCSLIYPLVVTPRMLCAYREKTDACQGDSGGPLVHAYQFKNVKRGGVSSRDPSVRLVGFAKYTQIGIVSWGQGCARPNKPGVYTRITEFLPWIRIMAQDGSFCEA